jgi:hypothetical protein
MVGAGTHPGAGVPGVLSSAAGGFAADLAECRRSLANGSRTFLAASLLLPREVREPACALYAWCRQADDEVDGQDGLGGDPAAAWPTFDIAWRRCTPAVAARGWPNVRWAPWPCTTAFRPRCPRR